MIIILIVLVIIIYFLIYGLITAYYNKNKFFRKRSLSKKKEIFLTFDDGPSKYSYELLELLNKYNIKATFFCVAEFAKENKKLIEKMNEDNHEIELHSLKHKNALLQGIAETRNDLEKSLNIMKDLNVNIKFYRPPWGDANLETIIQTKKRGLELIWWNVMAEDWEANTISEEIANKLIERTQNGDIICLHDGRGKNDAPKRTIEALKIVIPIFLEKGYVFKTIKEYEK